MYDEDVFIIPRDIATANVLAFDTGLSKKNVHLSLSGTPTRAQWKTKRNVDLTGDRASE